MEDATERLFEAAVVGDTEVLEQLADEHPADVDVIFSKRNDQGDLASYVALQHGHFEFALRICSYFPAALWERNGKGDGLLHMAAKLGRRDFFLYGAILLSLNFQGFSSYAVEHDERRRDAMTFTNSAVNVEGKSLFYVAAEKGYLEAGKLLLENQAYCADMDRAFMGPDGSTALHIATRNRNYDMVQIFLQHGVPESIITRQEVETGYTPLHIAVSLDEPRLAEMFLTSHPSSANILDSDGFSPLHLAVRLNMTEMLELFLRHCPDCCNNKTLTDKGQNALHIAVEGNNEDLISVIVKDRRLSELMINQQDENGNTPLHLATYRGDKKMQDTLLGCQTKVKPLRNKAGLTFEEVAKLKVNERLFKAAVAGATEVLEQLAAEHPADADVIFSIRNDDGDLASHVALQYGRYEFVLKICSYHPAALWEHNGKGDGLLHMAAKLGHRDFFLQGARLLSQHFHGFSSYADEHDERRRDAMKFTNAAVNREGKSLLYVAAENGYDEAAKLLLENKAYCADMDRAFMGPDGSTALQFSTRNRNYDMVRIFLQHAPERIVTRKEFLLGYTPLHSAVSLDEPRLAELFLTSHPSSADILDGDGFSPLHLAVRMNQTEMLQLFLRHCPDCCMTLTDKGQNALHIAADKNIEGVNSVIVKDRRLSKLMINQQDKNGNTPLHLAAYRGNKKMQDTLLSCQAKVKPLRNKAGLTFEEVAELKLKVIEKLFKAAVVGDTVSREQLTVKHPEDVIFSIRNDQGDLASHVALKHGHHEFALRICCSFPAALWELNGKGDGLLHMAAKLGHHEFFLRGAHLLYRHFHGFRFADERIMDAMKFANSAVNGEGKSLLYVAAENGYDEAVELLLENGAYCADMDRAFTGPDGSTALHIATRNRNYDMVQIFLRHGRVPDRIITRQEVETRNTPLHIAVSLNEPRLAELILTTHPPNPDILDRDGFSPFHLAVRLNQTEMLQLFLRHCPDCCNSKTLTYKRQNALHIAVEKNIEGLISVIVKDKRLSELMVNQQDEDGNTPLHLAAYRDDMKMQDTLLGCQATVQPLKNNAGLTFQDVAKRKTKEKMQSKLIKGMEDFQSSLLVMATLIITVTFTAAFTLPGGYNGNQPNQGMATLVDRTGFAVFLVTDAMSMVSSIVATAALILFPVVISTEKQFNTLKVAIGAIVVSIIFMLVAFTAGVWSVIGSQHRWLAIFIAVITSFIPLCLILLVARIMLGSGIKVVRVFDEER